MSEHIPPSELRLLALARYINALEQGEIEPLIEVLRAAESDPVLAELLQEVHALYQENEHIAISELEARQAVQTALAPLAVSTLRQNGHKALDRQQINHLSEIDIPYRNQETIMDEQTIVMPLGNHDELPPPPRRRWLSLMAAILTICVLVAGTPILLNLRGNTSTGSQIQSTPIATATPQSIHNTYKTLASHYVSQMNLADEIGQLIMAEYSQTSYSSDLDYMINTLHVGGVIMYKSQLTSLDQAKGDTQHMQQRASIPLLISTDQEGGYVDRLTNIYGNNSMSPAQIGKSGDVNVATQQGLKTSQELTALGINVDLAPVLDVNQANDYDPTRAFGNTADQVIKYAGAYLQAMQSNGTVACAKDFPGLGAATTTANSPLRVVTSTKQQIYDIDLAPFKAFIQSPNTQLNPGMIMSTDALMPAIDPRYPAELSHTFITDILRNEFGYDGVVLTDALYMQSIIQQTGNIYTAAVMALQAGNDMLLGATDLSQTEQMINAIKQAVQNGTLTKARIDASVTRIIALKMQYHLMSTTA